MSATWRVESKTTAGDSIRVERAWLQKISAEALATNRMPVLAFGFDAGRHDWMAFELPVAERLMRAVAHLARGDVRRAQEEIEALPVRIA